MNHKHRLLCTLLALLVALFCALGAFAEDQIEPESVLDPTKDGSLTLTMKNGSDNPVPGGTVELYLLAHAVHNPYAGDDLEWLPEYAAMPDKPELTNEGLSIDFPVDGTLADSNNAQAALLFEQFIKDNGYVSSYSGLIDDAGTITFTSLPLGLYLVRQTAAEAAKGFYPMQPFLVTVPGRLPNGHLQYEVDAAPKMQPLSPIPTPAPTPTPEPSQPPEGGDKPSGTLPQTGQLNWPVPLLAALGMTLFLAGWMLRRKEDDRNA